MYLNHFPELAYAVLRFAHWEKYIKKTIFFIGRSEKRQLKKGEKTKTYQIDLDLPYKSVSRQHALITFNN